VKLVHPVGFIIKKFVTFHGHTNVKYGNERLEFVVLLEENTAYLHIVALSQFLFESLM
jgi:hypothetical protein